MDAFEHAVGGRLPENADLKAVLAGYVNQTGRTCTISDFRYEGGTPAGDAYYEVGCTGALGFIIKHTAANETVATDCVQAIGTNLECKLTSAEAIKAADRAAIDKLAAASGKACTIKDTRTIGKLVNDPELHDDLLAAVKDLKATAAQANNDNASAGALETSISIFFGGKY